MCLYMFQDWISKVKLFIRTVVLYWKVTKPRMLRKLATLCSHF